MQFNKKIHALFPNFTKHQKLFFLLLVIVTGIAVLWPIHDFQYYIAQGDHGRDLYAFKKTMEGQVPYLDYSWVLGPLMPYYYALLFKIFGATIQTAVLGQNILILATGILLFFTCSLFLSPMFSYLCALVYWSFRGTEFFYTYVHIGGIVCLLGALFCILSYIKKPDRNLVWPGYFCIMLLILIRANVGVSTLVGYTSLLYLINFVKPGFCPEDKIRPKGRLLKSHRDLSTLVLRNFFKIPRIKSPQFFKLQGIGVNPIVTLQHFMSGVLSLSRIQCKIWVKKDSSKYAPPNKFTYLLLAIGIVLLGALIYWAIIYQLPKYAIFQCFPYDKSHRSDSSGSILTSFLSLGRILIMNVTGSLSRGILSLLLLLLTSRAIFLLSRKNEDKEIQRNWRLAFLAVFVFLVLTSHEFILSGVFYRLFWVLHIFVILVFFVMDYGTRNFSFKGARALLITAVFLACFFQVRSQNLVVELHKTPYHLLQIGKNRTYSFQSPQWIITVTNTVDFILKNTSPDEKILALPFDPIYYFLSDRDGATRESIFFEHKNITTEQEMDVISDIEKNHVRYIILSSRCNTPEPGMGVFGITHCRILNNYIMENYQLTATFGNWKDPSGWAWNHGTKIYKRIK